MGFLQAHGKELHQRSEVLCEVRDGQCRQIRFSITRLNDHGWVVAAQHKQRSKQPGDAPIAAIEGLNTHKVIVHQTDEGQDGQSLVLTFFAPLEKLK